MEIWWELGNCDDLFDPILNVGFQGSNESTFRLVAWLRSVSRDHNPQA